MSRLPLEKLNGFTFNHSDQQDRLYDAMSSAEVKQRFDSRAEELRAKFNALIDKLQSIVDGDSGADNVKATSIEGLTGDNVQTLLESLKTLVDKKSNSLDVFSKIELQSVTDGNSGADKVRATPIDTSPDNIQGILEWLKSQIDSTVLGQIPDGSITDAKLSNLAGQIKEVLMSHLAKKASLTEVGHVQLSSATNSVDETTAATPKAVKTAYDLANEKQVALPVENRRKITFGTAEPTGGVDGDIYLQYE